MFVSYADNHVAGTYCMLNLKKKAVWKTCNIKWVTSNIVPYEAWMKREDGGNVTIYGDNDDKDDNYDGIVQNINNNI